MPGQPLDRSDQIPSNNKCYKSIYSSCWCCFPRILTAFMISISSLVSPRLRDALISRTEHLLDTMDPSHYNNPRRVVQFLRHLKYSHRPLLEKCNQIILCNIPRLDAENISMIMGLYQSLQFNNCDFRLAVKQRLTELIDSSTEPFTFTKLFVALAPMASPEIKEGFVFLSIHTCEYKCFTVVFESHSSNLVLFLLGWRTLPSCWRMS